ncbi:hypothetical protein [Nonomuraea sp. NPDC003709]|uniref:hypothetical protein n=1 Tax=Nonomuraea sp. NPDC003709 TaxID=3154450 RepID=UPI0033B7F1BF
MSTTQLIRSEWPAFRRSGRLIALAAAGLIVIAVGLQFASGNRSGCDGPCRQLVSYDDTVVRDQFSFLHRDLGREGGITVRLTSMTGTITYPPPNHDQIVPGLVPWAKAGIVIKDGVRPGSRYAALMMTGGHGVRFQYDYTHDVAGRGGDVSQQSPRWLRLTRSGDNITGAESTDGRQWHTVASAKLDGLPDNVQVGLFATSPNNLTLRKAGLGGAMGQERHTQAVGVFDNVTLDGAAAGAWHSEPVGGASTADWEKRNPSRAVEKDGVITVSGSGDIGPSGDEGVKALLLGLPIGLIIVLIVAAHYGAALEAPSRRVIDARTIVVAAATFVTGLVAVGIVVPAGMAILKGNGILVPVPMLTGARVVTGLAVVLALCGIPAFGLGLRLRRGWTANLIGLSLIALPYTVATLPLLPDPVSEWLLRLTPAAGFAVQQTMTEYPQVTAHYAPSAGYFPLPWWAGLAVLGAYTVIVMWIAVGRKPVADTDWR